jgi:hypothetical protein
MFSFHFVSQDILYMNIKVCLFLACTKRSLSCVNKSICLNYGYYVIPESTHKKQAFLWRQFFLIDTRDSL